MTAQRQSRPTQPKPSPIMLGCAFAINRQYFWDLGAYDNQLLIWNAENYELSFKLWLCGGELLECPCSRVAHVFRRHNEFRKLNGIDFVGRNFKRIAEVWMDDWKRFLFLTNPKRYESIDAGDLTEQKSIREKLHCKPFDYFVHFVAPELLKINPIPKPDDIAYGVVKTFLNSTNFCITDYDHRNHHCTLSSMCSKPYKIPVRSQYFHLNKHQIIKHDRTPKCLDNPMFKTIKGYTYHKSSWKYNFETKQIVLHRGRNLCVAADIYSKNITLAQCDATQLNQRWTFGYVNETVFQTF